LSNDAGALETIADIFADTEDTRIYPVLLKLIVVDGQPYEVLEHCVLALRRVGDARSLEPLRSFALRGRDAHFDRVCALTEVAINARASGRDLLANSNEELRSLTERYLHALETSDPKAYIEVHAFGFRRNADEAKIRRDVFDRPEMSEILQPMKRSAGRESFEINREKLEASLVVDGRYKLTYVFEVDGWKIAEIERIAP